MLRVAEQYAGTDTGRQRRANEDSVLAHAPLFVVADGMGGAQAGEVASRLAVDEFRRALREGDTLRGAGGLESELAQRVREANARIHERSQRRAEQAGMGTTLTAIHVGPERVSVAHVGDSRAYRLRDGLLERLTEDHTLVDELIRQGRLSPEEASEHPQRSVITRALGPEAVVDVDTSSLEGQAGDIYLLCSDGLTTMVPEESVAAILKANPRLRDAGEALIAAANEAGGRDNITVVLVRLEEVHAARAAGDGRAHGAARERAPEELQTAAHVVAPADVGAIVADAREAEPAAEGEKDELAPAGAGAVPAGGVQVRRPRPPQGASTPTGAGPPQARRRRRIRRGAVLAGVLIVLGLLGGGAYAALESVYFIGTNGRGLVTLYRGVPLKLPAGLALYSSDYVTGVSASTLSPSRRHQLLDHSLRSEGNAAALIRSLELGQLE
jgi:PPM family protein phosphatase